MLIALIVVGTVATLLAAATAYLWAARTALKAETARLSESLGAADAERVKLRDENRELLTRVERLDAENRAAGQRLEDARRQFAEAQTQAQQQAREAFQSLAGEALKQSSDQFLQLARKTFEGEQKDAVAQLEQRKQAIESILRPIRETLDKHATAVTEIERHREGAYHGLRQQLASMVESQQQLRDQTGNLVTALRRADVRGRWGEVQLRRIAELAGMIPHCDFDEQVTVKTIDGVQKPDMVVRLPAGRNLVIDAKTPMVAFLDAIQCDDEETRTECFRRHLEHIQQKVKELGAKRYQDQFERTPDFVILFIPGESFLQPVMQLAPDLIERAMNQGVVIATPTTLVSLLKAVEMGWREERVAENANRISELGRELHERIATATTYVENVGKHLENAVKSYNQFVGSYETRVLVTARKFRDLGADSPRELPAEGGIKQVDSHVREVKALEA
jgi:DNA recombination protein RmuC